MERIRKNVSIGQPKRQVDYLIGDEAYELKRGIRERFRLRGVLTDFAEIVTVSQLERGTLVLIEPELSTETLAEIWEGAERVIRPEVLARLAMVASRLNESGEIELICHPAKLPEPELERIVALVRKDTDKPSHFPKPAPGNSPHEVLRVLVARWLEVANAEITPEQLAEETGSSTIAKLGEHTGYTYKPVRQALDGLSKHLIHHGNRGVQLMSFPREAWAKLVMNADSLRETVRFRSQGEMPRTPASLLKRFRRIPAAEVSHVGIGGVEGARYYDEPLDMIGLPRLDFTVHCPDGPPDLEFVRQLDPDLAPVDNPTTPCSLVIHLLRRPRSYFENRYADPAECLLDLQEMKLHEQARAFLRSFPTSAKEDL